MKLGYFISRKIDELAKKEIAFQKKVSMRRQLRNIKRS